MRNAVARVDEDFEADEPAPRKRAPRTTPAGRATASRPAKGRKRKRGSHVAVDMQKVARWGAIGMSLMVALGIIVNALLMQTGRHPAPLFGHSIALGDSASSPAPAKPRAATGNPAPQPAEAPAPPSRPQQAATSEDAPSAAPANDPIGRLISGAPMGSDRSDAKTVSGAQRALAKLGFAVKATGTLGPQTRKAIEAFEKDRHLPVNGELNRRLVKILAAESGLKIER